MFREVYRVEDREDRERWLCPLVGRFLSSFLGCLVRDRWKTIIKIQTEFVSSQKRFEPSGISFREGRNKPAPMRNLLSTRRQAWGIFESYLDDLVSRFCSSYDDDPRF